MRTGRPQATLTVHPSGQSGLFGELGVDPVHVGAKLAPDHLDLMPRLLLAHPVELLLAGPVLGDPLAREVARLELVRTLRHRLARLRPDHPLAPGPTAALGAVRYRAAH